MDTVLYHKFTQHNGLMRELLATGDAELIEVSTLSRRILISERLVHFADAGLFVFLELG